MKELWTVESGCYSDHTVMAVFDDEKTAEAWAQALRDEPDGWHTDAYVGRLMFIPGGKRPKKVTTYSQSAEVWDGGNVDLHEMHARSEFPIESYYGPPPKRPAVRYVRAPCHNGKGGRIEVRGSTEASVAKVMSERIAMWKAGAWGGPGCDEINEQT